MDEFERAIMVYVLDKVSKEQEKPLLKEYERLKKEKEEKEKQNDY